MIACKANSDQATLATRLIHLGGVLPDSSLLWPRQTAKGSALAGVLALAVAATCTVSPTRAVGQSGPTDLERAFQATVQNPNDPEAAFRYARLAAAAGQPQAAIAALERVLRINPRLDNVRLELASLYYSVGSNDLAALYARQALNSPDIPPEVAERARQLLALADTGSRRSRFSGTAFAGVRYDTNATEQPLAGVVTLNNQPINLGPNATGRYSWSSVLSTRLTHQRDLGLQRQANWETNLGLYDQRYGQIPREYDLNAGTLDSGPEVEISRFGAGVLTVRPFVSGTYVLYGDAYYAGFFGGGGSLQFLSREWTLRLTGILQATNYQNSSFRPTARDNTGGNGSLSASIGYSFGPTTQLTAIVGVSENSTRQEYLNNWGGFGVLAFGTTFTVGTYQLGASTRVGYRRFQYGGPDPFLDPGITRNDRRYEAGATLVAPITGQLALTLEYDYLNVKSNIELFEYDNHTTILGLRVNF
jgi:tetratricopeptide (TPR) repeat protein